MADKKDYSEYKPDNHERYYMLRANNQYVKYNYFNNQARFDEIKKSVNIFVDNGKEDFAMQDYMDTSDLQHGRSIGPDKHLTPQDIADYEESDAEERAENEKYREYFSKKHGIDFNNSEYWVKNITDEPMYNIFCGCRFSLNIGTGILDFIYADFHTPYKAEETFAYAMEHLFTKTASEHKDEITQKLQEAGYDTDSKSEPIKVLSIEDEIYEDYIAFQATMSHIKHIGYASVYSAICPPLFRDEYRKPYSAMKVYYNYLRTLQKEFLDLIEFCFDDEYYPDILGKFQPYERFYLYRSLKDIPVAYDRTETFKTTTWYMPEKGVPIWLTDPTYLKKTTKKMKTTSAITELAEKFNISPQKLKEKLVTPIHLDKYYHFSTVAQILELEFTKMLEMDIGFRKCKWCGKYFIVKGNHGAKYCDRVPEGKTQSCQKLAALDEYKRKNADNEAKKIYDKYYKRYSARLKVNQIKEKDFKQWKYNAITMRDECNDGKIALQEYIDWNEAAFPNRAKKN